MKRHPKVTFKIKSKPGKPDCYKHAILFEVVNNAKLKFFAKKEATLKPALTKSGAVFNSKRVPLVFNTESVAKPSAKTPTAGPTCRTFLVHSIFNKPAKPAQCDIYKNSFDDCEEVDEARRLVFLLSSKRDLYRVSPKNPSKSFFKKFFKNPFKKSK